MTTKKYGNKYFISITIIILVIVVSGYIGKRIVVDSQKDNTIKTTEKVVEVNVPVKEPVIEKKNFLR
jgi:uncharacterized alpha/beta hydrolase family protein